MASNLQIAIVIISALGVMFWLGWGACDIWRANAKQGAEHEDITHELDFGQASKSVESEADEWLKAEDREIKKSIDKYV